MIDKIEMLDKEAFKVGATPLRTLAEIRLFADKLNEVINAVNVIGVAMETITDNINLATESMKSILIGSDK